MKSLQRATPCVGICSTTYGDLVCRGCKRYAHEIVQWNGYTDAQRDVVWERLFDLRAEAVSGVLELSDTALFEAAATEMKLPADGPWPLVAYELLRRIVRRDQPVSEFGLRTRDDSMTTLSLLQAIDAEIYERSRAHYEHSYRVSAE